MKCKPASLVELEEVVNSFVGSLDSADVVKAARHTCLKLKRVCMSRVETSRGAKKTI